MPDTLSDPSGHAHRLSIAGFELRPTAASRPHWKRGVAARRRAPGRIVRQDCLEPFRTASLTMK